MHSLRTFLPVLGLAVQHTGASCGYGTAVHKRAEDGQVPISTFGYVGTVGPTNWLALDPGNNSVCATGKNQSPINLVDGQFNMVDGASLTINLPDIPETEFENLGSTVEVVVPPGATMNVEGMGQFNLAQFHFHLPSEHLDNGTGHAMEMHMVFEGEQKQLVVVSNFIDVPETASAEPSLLDTIFASASLIATPGTKTAIGPLVMSGLQADLAAGHFKAYTGSLTTPPCSEGVPFFIATQPQSISIQSFDAVRSVIGFNARFPQNALGEDNILALASTAAAAVAV